MRLKLLALILVLLSPTLSLDLGDIFLGINMSIADSTHGQAIFTLQNPLVYSISADASKLNFYPRWNNTPVYNTSMKIAKFNETLNRTQFVPLESETFLAGRSYIFLVEAHWDSRLGVSVDWVPYLTIADTNYTMVDWAWWNVTSEIFYDNFEDGSVSDTWILGGAGTLNWNAVDDAVVINGTWSAHNEDADGTAWMNKTIDVTGYGNLKVKFSYITTGLDTGENLYFRWYNGTHWNTTLTTQAVVDSIHFINVTLQEAQKSNFRLSFACDGNTPGDDCYVDDVRVLGNRTAGVLNVTWHYPKGLNVSQNESFQVNATITCLGGDCGYVNASLYYNASASYPNTLVSNTFRVSPFYFTSGGVGGFSVDASLISGLDKVTELHAKPNIFYLGDRWNLIAGRNDGLFDGWTWDGSTWQDNASLVTGLTDVGSYATPTTLYWGNNWNLICGNSSGLFTGFTWNGTAWISNSSMVNGLDSFSTYTAPFTFYLYGSPSLISGNAAGGFRGWTWDGTTWNVNVSLNTSLYSDTTYSVPAVFQMGNIYYIIFRSSGGFMMFSWNGHWNLHGTYNDFDFGLFLSPSVWQTENRISIIVGNYSGEWKAITANASNSQMLLFNESDYGTFGWELNTTGAEWSNWKLNVSFTGTPGIILPNSTENFQINITGGAVEEPPEEDNVTIIVFNYPDDDVVNDTTKNITFGFTPTFYGGVPVNCSLYTNETATWEWTASNMTVVVNTSLNTIQHNFTENGTYIWSIGCWDETVQNFTNGNRTLEIAEPVPEPPDSEEPNIGLFKYNVTSGGNYSAMQGYQFNSTVTDENLDSVWIEHNFTGTMLNNTVLQNNGDEYYYDYGLLGASSYHIKWYANDTYGNLNDTDSVKTYIVYKTNQILTTDSSNGTSLIYGNWTTVSGAGNYTPCLLYDNDTEAAHPFSGLLGAWEHTFVWNTTGNQNYTDNTTSIVISVAQLSQPLTLVSSNGTSLTYGNYTTITGGGNLTDANLYENDTLRISPYTSMPGAWVHTFVWNVSGDANHTANSTDVIVTVGKASQPLLLTITPSLSETYGTETTATGSGNLTIGTLYRNGTEVSNGESLILAAGHYNYTFNVMENANYTANSTSDILVIDQASSAVTLAIDPASPIIYGTESNFSCELDTAFTPTLYLNTTDITAENNLDIVRGAGTYLVNCTWEGNENYTGDEDSSIYVIEQASQPLELVVTPSLNEVYGVETTATGSGNLTSALLHRNGTEVDNGEALVLAAGHYNYTFNSTGNQNYTANSTSSILVIDQASSRAHLTTTPDSPITYGTDSNFACWLNVSFVPTIYLNTTDITGENDTLVTRAAGTYLVNCTWAGNENYTGSENSTTYVINKAPQILTLVLSPSASEVYGTETSATGGGNETIALLYRNNTQVTNGESLVLAAGHYKYVFNTSGNTNYSENSTSDTLVIVKASSEIMLFINGTRSSRTLYNDSWANFTVNLTMNWAVELWSNLSGSLALMDSSISTVMNYTDLSQFDLGNYLIKGNWTGNENYTGDYEEWVLTIAEFIEVNETAVGYAEHFSCRQVDDNMHICIIGTEYYSCLNLYGDDMECVRLD